LNASVFTALVQIFNHKSRRTNLYTDNLEVDYRNYDVTLGNIIRVLTDRHAPGTARSKRLLSDANSNVLLYITGHGGAEFMKVQVHSLFG
jgi:phosphatidylinositol glycan class K